MAPQIRLRLTKQTDDSEQLAMPEECEEYLREYQAKFPDAEIVVDCAGCDGTGKARGHGCGWCGGSGTLPRKWRGARIRGET